MTFLQLYGVELDRELGSSQTSLFTTVARKAAINAAQLEWAKRTECLQLQASVALVDAVQETDLETSLTDFMWIARQGISIKIVSSTQTRYIEGDDLAVTSVERLNAEEPGWRAVDAATPMKVYTRRVGGAMYLGLHPAPSIDVTETWTALVPYVIYPTDMSADGDQPFTVSANVLLSMKPWHRALVHYAAYDLEKLRKDQARSAAQLQLFELEVAKFIGVEKPKGGQRVRFAVNYRRPRFRPSGASAGLGWTDSEWIS